MDDLTEYILEDMSWPSGDIDSTAITALNTAIGSHTLGYFSETPVTAFNIMQELLDPFLAWMYVDIAGDFQLGRLVEPSGGSLFINEFDLALNTEIIVEDDLAINLTDTYAGRKNQYVITVESAAGGLSEQDKQTVAADYRLIRKSSNTLDDFYDFAVDGCPKAVSLQDETSIERELDRLTDIYGEKKAVLYSYCIIRYVYVPDFRARFCSNFKSWSL